MAIKASVGLRNMLLSSSTLATAMAGGLIKIYSGAAPATASAAATGTLLCVVSNDSSGVGINFSGVAVGGVLQKSATEVWSGANTAAGVAGYYRHVASGDTGAESDTEPRLQGVIGVAGADMNMTSVNMVEGATQTVDYYTVSLPSF